MHILHSHLRFAGKSALAIGAALLLASCTLAPAYTRPQAPVSAAWPTGTAYQDGLTAKDKAAATIVTWESFFRSAPLRKIIALALDNNRDLRVAVLNIQSARAAYRIQRADLLPEIDAKTAMTRTGTPKNASLNGVSSGKDSLYTNYTANVGTTAFELDLFGRVRSLDEEAVEKFLQAKDAARAARISLIAETANAYLTLLADRKLTALTKDTLKAQTQAYALIKTSFDKGIGSRLDVSQAKSSVEAARVNLAKYARQEAQDKNALTLLTGTPIDDKFLKGEKLDDVKLMKNIPVGLPSAVLLARPDILAAEHNLKAANADIGAARAAFFPTISLTSTLGFASTSLSKLFTGGAYPAWTFAPAATLPIFAGGRNMAALDSAKTQREIAVAQYEKAIQAAFREVADALAARGTLTAQMHAQNELVDTYKTAYDISQARYTHGIDSHLNVLDAQRSLYAAQQDAVDVERQRLSNLVALYAALGGGAR